MPRLGSLGCHTGPSEPRVDEQRTATRTKSLLSQLHTGHTGRNTLAVVDLSPKYLTKLTLVASSPLVNKREGGEACFAADFFTAAVWCVPFSGAVGLFNKLQTQKKGA